MGPTRAGDTDRLLHGQRPAVSSSPAAVRRSAANAGSATLSADVGSCTETCVVMHNRQRKLFSLLSGRRMFAIFHLVADEQVLCGEGDTVIVGSKFRVNNIYTWSGQVTG